jgi:putative hydrolases of HD superfamily
MKQLTEKSKFNLSLNTHRCIKMSLVHDIGEAIVGDITPYDGVLEEDKFKLEQEALMKLTNYLKESKICETVSLEIFDLWKEYEENKTKEAMIVKDIDKFDMILQAVSTKESC